MAKKEGVVKKIVKAKKKGVAKKHRNRHETFKRSVGQGK